MAILNFRFLGGRGLLANQIYVGRAVGSLPGSPLANPYRVGRDGTRAEVVQKYRRWLWSEIKAYLADPAQPSPAVSELLRLVDLRLAGESFDLVCWCAPEPCHAEVIEAAIAWGIESGDLLPF